MKSASDRLPPMFVGEDPALDFLNSVACPKATVIDWLDTEASLLDWLAGSGLCQEAELVPLSDAAQASELTKALKHIHEFRDEFRDFIRATAGQKEVPTTHPLIAEINAILLGRTPHIRIETLQDADGAKQTLGLITGYDLRSPRDLLPRIAAACAKLICEADFSYVRNCEGPKCSLYFLDVSKNHKRRWCSMSVCGNRAKAAAHRKAKAATSCVLTA